MSLLIFALVIANIVITLRSVQKIRLDMARLELSVLTADMDPDDI